ncbi:WASH complex subunit 3 [Trypanosoma melophagium]|uniref:WASH complex subunit 3 n=1 Tax=Trypanosoma melophagium TaxID=715481 RepID=UPI003519DC6B|nr:WASH complex subunit 3 [Trypanosoma melophagium]
MTTRALAQAQREEEFMRTADTVNRFLISTVQFLNRFAAQCDAKLFETSRSLQRLESLTALLEYKLNSVDNEFDETETSAAPFSAASPSSHTQNVANNLGNLTITDRNIPPPMPGLLTSVGNRHGPPPPPPPSSLLHQQLNRQGPPPPPGVTIERNTSGVTVVPQISAIAGPSPVLLLQPPPGFVPPPPPPMPLLGGYTMSTHPRLRGYFDMLALRVPDVAIKAKMQADGYQPEWLDTPDAVAPPTLSTTDNVSYESD